jgi:hygromycin-B 4-O-kinase
MDDLRASVPASVIEVLNRRFGMLTPAGAGAWSVAYRTAAGATEGGGDRIVRVGRHASDFRVDAEMATYSSAQLPIPKVFEIAQLDAPDEGWHVCVSDFAPGQPLETVTSEQWVALVPAVVDLLESMRAITPPAGAATPPWSAVLLDRDDGDDRLGDWQQRLAGEPELLRAYEKSMARLRALCAQPAVADVKPTLLHCDLINRNVHVAGGDITGVFDWGCRRWGDHLYELAWFEFWAPWHPNLDVGLLRDGLANRWGHDAHPDRLAACLLHIGADHLVYHAAIGEPQGGRDVLSRMAALDLL